MATIDATPGSPTANSFATVSDFREYASTRQPSFTWLTDTTTDDEISGKLIAACRRLSPSLEWTGIASTDTQILPWPRKGMLSANGFAIPDNVNPLDLIYAQCELAGQMGDADLMSDDAAAKAGVSGVTAGSVSVQFQSRDISSVEAVDVSVRKSSPEFAYLSLPDAVRLLLVPSWYKISTLRYPGQLQFFGGVRRLRRPPY